MSMTRFITLSLFAGLFLMTGCAQPVASDMTLNRGAQLLAAGSPKSAIPVLTQTVASTPDGPEPLALLALAYALDLQPDRAIAEAQLIHRPKDSHPGWEIVAIGIAEMTRHRHAEAAVALQQVIAADPTSPIATSARQWLALAQILKGDNDKAIDTLQILAKSPGMQTSAELWIALIHMQHGRTKEATDALALCAQHVTGQPNSQSPAANLTSADDQTLYDAAVTALAKRELESARRIFQLVKQHNPDGSDAAVWLALIAGAHDNWQTCRNQLKDACDNGSHKSRGLANQLFSVVCAAEERPDALVQHTLAGQRRLNRAENPAQTVNQPQPDHVWFSDNMK